MRGLTMSRSDRWALLIFTAIALMVPVGAGCSSGAKGSAAKIYQVSVPGQPGSWRTYKFWNSRDELTFTDLDTGKDVLIRGNAVVREE